MAGAIRGATWWTVAFLLACGLNTATAVLRLREFFPQPRPADFASYYAGAWALRLHVSPYAWSPDFLARLARTTGLAIDPAVHNSPPAWAALMLPLTLVSFPLAAWLWLGLSLALLAYAAVHLSQMAGNEGRRAHAAVFVVALLFGPTFLSVSLGQNTLVLLVAALACGRVCRAENAATASPGASLWWLAAVAAKLFPLAWIVAMARRGRQRSMLGWLVRAAALFGGIALLVPGATREYFAQFLAQRTTDFASSVGIDDGSLLAWLSRLTHATRFEVPGMDPRQHTWISWTPPWNADAHIATAIAAIGVAAIGVAYLRVWRRASATPQAEGLLYAAILLVLLCLPHMERYDDVLALPALAWLWGRGERERCIAIAAFALFSAARLTHPIALACPWPWGALGVGVSVYARLLAIAGILRAASRPPASAESRT